MNVGLRRNTKVALDKHVHWISKNSEKSALTVPLNRNLIKLDAEDRANFSSMKNPALTREILLKAAFFAWLLEQESACFDPLDAYYVFDLAVPSCYVRMKHAAQPMARFASQCVLDEGLDVLRD